jgi:integrase
MPRYPGVRKLGKNWFFRIQYKHQRIQEGPFDTAQEASEARAEYLRKLKAGTVTPGSITVKQLCIKYLEEHSKIYNRHTFYTKVEATCRNHIIPVIGTRRIGDLIPNDMRLFQKHCIQSTLPTGAPFVMRILKAIFNWAVEWELMGSNPIRGKIPPRPVTIHPTLSPDQLRRLMREIPVRDKVVVGLGVFAGLRISEIFALRWSDIDFQDNTLSIRRQFSAGILNEPKTDSSASVVPQWEPLVRQLKI